MIRGFSKYLNYIIWGNAILINKITHKWIMHFLSNLLIVNLQFLLNADNNASYHVVLEDVQETSNGKKHSSMYPKILARLKLIFLKARTYFPVETMLRQRS